MTVCAAQCFSIGVKATKTAAAVGDNQADIAATRLDTAVSRGVTSDALGLMSLSAN